MATLQPNSLIFLETAWQKAGGPLTASTDTVAEADRLAVQLYLAAASDDHFTDAEKNILKANGIDSQYFVENQWSKWYALYSTSPDSEPIIPEEEKYRSILAGLQNANPKARLNAVAFFEPETCDSPIVGRALLNLIFNDPDSDIREIAFNRISALPLPQKKLWLKSIALLHTDDSLVEKSATALIDLQEQESAISERFIEPLVSAKSFTDLNTNPISKNPKPLSHQKQFGIVAAAIGTTLTAASIYLINDANEKMSQAALEGNPDEVTLQNNSRTLYLTTTGVGAALVAGGGYLLLHKEF